MSDVGVNPSPLQALLGADSASFNPFTAPAAALLSALPQNRARSVSDSGNLQVLTNGPLFNLPAGALYASLRAGDSESGFATSSTRLGVAQAIRLSRNDLNAQANLDLPIASRRKHFLSALGELSVNANLAVNQLSGFGALTTVGYGVNWTPVTGVNFIVSHTRDSAAPSVQQLGNPTVLTAGTRILDYATGQTVDVTQIAGGNAALQSDHRDVFKIGLTLKPVSTQDLTITANYIATRIDNPIQSFPVATAQIEAAFPDRFLRDATGELYEVDDPPRPTSPGASARRSAGGFNYSRPTGKAPPPPPGPSAGTPRPGRASAGQRRGA